MMLTWLGRTDDGGQKRQFATLDLDLNRISLFPMNWTLVHPITADSPLAKTADDLRDMHIEVLVMVKGIRRDLPSGSACPCLLPFRRDPVEQAVCPMYRSVPGQPTIVDLALGCHRTRGGKGND